MINNIIRVSWKLFHVNMSSSAHNITRYYDGIARNNKTRSVHHALNALINWFRRPPVRQLVRDNGYVTVLVSTNLITSPHRGKLIK